MIAKQKCIIDLTAIKHNIEQIKKRMPQHEIIAIVKSDAYGHGLLPVCQALPESVSLGIVNIQHAIQLRQKKLNNNIILLTGIYNEEELEIASKLGFSIVIHQMQQLDLVQQSKQQNLCVWLKINTGMNRLGFNIQEAEAAYKILNNNVNVSSLKIMSHFACADNKTGEKCQKQITNMQDLIKRFPNAVFSLDNSAAIINNILPSANWIRPGIMLYGVSPIPGITSKELQLKPCMTLKAMILSINQVKQGEYIGYGATYQCPHDMLIANINIGYGHGYPRHAKIGTPVYYDNKICSLVGRVSMDLISVDVSKIINPKVGDFVTLWGENLPIEIVAAAADTIPYELCTQLNKTIHKEFIK